MMKKILFSLLLVSFFISKSNAQVTGTPFFWQQSHGFPELVAQPYILTPGTYFSCGVNYEKQFTVSFTNTGSGKTRTNIPLTIDVMNDDPGLLHSIDHTITTVNELYDGEIPHTVANALFTSTSIPGGIRLLYIGPPIKPGQKVNIRLKITADPDFTNNPSVFCRAPKDQGCSIVQLASRFIIGAGSGGDINAANNTSFSLEYTGCP